MIYFGGLIGEVFENINGIIQHALRPLFYSICSLLYKIVIYLYNVFEFLCTSRLLKLDVVNELSTRVGLILGLVMLFSIIFSFIKNLIDPDAIKDKNKSPINIIKKVLIVIVLLGTSNFIFNGLYYVQNLVIKSHVLNKILMPANVEADNFGALLAARMFSAFYTVDSDVADYNINATDNLVNDCSKYADLLPIRIYKYEKFEIGNKCLNEAVAIEIDGEEEDRFIIDFSYILCLITAFFLIYFLFSYCISVGVRMIQLAFLEIIAPMAIVGYLQPKDDNMLTKWLKIYVSTYIDVFIRIVIINFAVFLIAILLDNSGNVYSDFWTNIGATGFTRTFILIIMIFALLTFAKKAPELLKELFPSGASKLGLGGFSFKNMLGGGLIQKGLSTGAKVATAGAAIGLLGAGISGISRYNANKTLGKGTGESLKAALYGGVTGFGRGLVAGGKKGGFVKNLSGAIKEQEKIDDKYMDLIAKGGTIAGMHKAKIKNLTGETEGQEARRKMTNMNNLAKFLSDSKSAADEMQFVKAAKDAWEQATQMNGETVEEYKARKKALGDEYRNLRSLGMQYAITGDKSLLNYQTTSQVTTEEKVQKYDENGVALIGQYETKQVTKEIVTEGNHFDDYAEDFDTNMAIKKIQNNALQASQYSTDNSVEYYDEANNSYQKFEGEAALNYDRNGTAADKEAFFKRFKGLEDKAKETEFKIRSDGYEKLQAEDEAAGVNDRRKPFERK